MQSAVWPRALSGDLDAIRTVLSIMGRRAKLFGLDAPTHVALGGISDVEFANEAARLIESINSHDSVNDFLRALPGSASRSVLTEPISPQTVPIDADWSNIDGPDPETTNTGTGTDDDIDADEFADVPDDILDTAESASLAIIENYRRQRSEAVAP